MSSPTADEVADWVDDVADVFDKGNRHWIMGRLADDRGGVCLVGAINVSVYTTPQVVVWRDDPPRSLRWTMVHEILTRAIARRDCNIIDIPAWNDHTAKNQQEVLDLIREAAKLVRTGELEVPA